MGKPLTVVHKPSGEVCWDVSDEQADEGDAESGPLDVTPPDPDVVTIDEMGRCWSREAREARAFVVEHLHYRKREGMLRFGAELKVRDVTNVMASADGFGPIGPLTTENADMFWDWSHIRDSSPAAMLAMRDKLKELGF